MTRIALSSLLATLALSSHPVTADEPLASDPGSWCGTASDPVAGTADPRTTRLRPLGAVNPNRVAAVGPCTEDGSRLDILIVYTPGVLATEGSLAAVQSLADSAIAELNLVFANSGVPTTAALAGLRETSYSESGSVNTDLTRLRTPGDGSLDEVHAWRDLDRADLVCLLVDSGDFLGIANYGVLAGYDARPDLGFSVVQRFTLTNGSGTFSHEIGHNLGLLHETASDPCRLLGADPAGHGYVEPGGVFRTVMGTGVEPVELRFSDPAVLVGGLPAGMPGDAENALVAAQSVVVASGFRNRDQDNDGVCDEDQIAADPGLDCNSNGILDQFETDFNGNGVPDDCDIASGTSLDVDLDGVPDEAELARVYVDADAAPGGDGAAWTTAMHDLQDALALARASMDTGEIWIAEGTYLPGPTKGDRFDLVGGVALLGGFEGTETLASQRDPDTNETVLSGDLLGDDLPDFSNHNDNSVTVAKVFDQTGLITLDGLTVTGGASLEHPGCQDTGTGTRYGGGLNAILADLAINDCTFEYNAALTGGGLYLASNVSWSLTDTDILHNAALGASGGAYAGGAYLAGELAPAIVDRCRFNGNRSDGSSAGAYIIRGEPEVTNTEFVGNTAATRSGGFYARLLTGGQFNQITVALNKAGDDGFNYVAGAHFSSDTVAFLYNSVFWGNVADNGSGPQQDMQSQLWIQGNTIPVFNTLQFWNLTFGGTSNNGDDPLFLDPIGPDALPHTGDEDARLGPGSLVIDSGDTFSSRNLDFDLLANPRRVGDAVDRGAYEDQTPPCPPDVNGDGILDNGDLGLFVSLFLAGDIATDFTGDGILDNGDIGAFVAAFLAGC